MNFQMEGNVFSKVIFLVLIAFAVYGSQAAQTTHPYFWKVEKGGKTSYLFGTIHEPVSIDELPCSQEVQHRLESSDLVFVEIDHLSTRSREVIDTQRQWMLSENGREMWALGKKSQEFFKSKGIDERLNLYGYSIMLSNLCDYGVDDLDGLLLDDRITKVAYSKGIPVQELDDFNEKMERIIGRRAKDVDAFNNLSGEAFWEVVRSIDQQIKQFDRQCPTEAVVNRIERYKTGMGVFSFLNTVNAVNTVEKERFFRDVKRRNQRWLARFEEAHGNYDRIFLAGGLAHFINPVGEWATFMNPVSLKSMLRDRGYMVEPVICEN